MTWTLMPLDSMKSNVYIRDDLGILSHSSLRKENNAMTAKTDSLRNSRNELNAEIGNLKPLLPEITDAFIVRTEAENPFFLQPRRLFAVLFWVHIIFSWTTVFSQSAEIKHRVYVTANTADMAENSRILA